MYWSLILSQYNFSISYLPSKENTQADALSRRDQDMPTDATDEQVQYRTVLLIKPEVVRSVETRTIVSRSVTCTKEVRAAPVAIDKASELATLWA
jgi:hypothetical protein